MAGVQRWLLPALALLLLLPSPALAGDHWKPTGELIVRLEGAERPSTERLERLASTDGVTGLSPLAGQWPLYRLALEAGRDLHSVASALERQPDIAWAEPDRWVELVPLGAPLDDTYWDELWHLENLGSLSNSMAGVDVHAVPAWDWATGDGIIVSVNDGGVDPSHPDLKQIEGIDVIDNDSDASPLLSTDSPAHGTAVSGLIAAIGNNGIGVAGVAWEATILPVRMIGAPATLGDLHDAFTLAVDRGASVINNSWGYRVDDCGPVSNSEIINDALSYATELGREGRGTSVVFAMGNENCHDQVQPMLEHPAAIGVGAINRSGVLHGYSNTGSNVDLVAPSGSLRSTDIVGPDGMNGLTEDYTDSMGGTSGACPLVSGVIALMYEANPRLTADEVQQVLCVTSDRVNLVEAAYDDAGWSDTYGCGRVDAAAAVSAVYNQSPPAPIVLAPADGEAVAPDRLEASWAAVADPDGEAISYALELRPEGFDDEGGDDDDDSAAEVPEVLAFDNIQDTWFVLEDAELSLGAWELQVWAVDSWGRGDASEIVEFEVAPPEEAPPEDLDPEDEQLSGQGCSCSGAAALGASPDAGTSLLLILALTALGRRRGPPQGAA